MSNTNGTAGQHKTAINPAPRQAHKMPRLDITQTVIPTMSVIVLIIGIAGVGYGMGSYKTKTESHLEQIDLQLSGIRSDLKEITKQVQKRSVRL